MKSILTFLRPQRTLLIAALLTAACCAVWAQDDGQAAGGPPPGEMRHGPNSERQLQQLTRVLALTTDQQAQVKTILDEQRAKMEELRKASSGTDASTPPSREQMEAIHNDTNTKITTLLNDDQKAKFAAWQKERQERMQRRGGGDGPPPSGV